MLFGETISAIATPPGMGGVAVIRVSGPDAFDIVRKLVDRDIKPGRIAFRRISSANGELLDEAVVLAFKAPRSYTGEDVVEVQCHGGEITSRRILAALIAAGARQARRGEFTCRALLNGKLDYSQAESVLDLINAKTVRAADMALETLSGAKREYETALYEEALDISTTLEHSLDIDEEELGEDFLKNIEARISTLREKLEQAIRHSREGHILRNGALVVLAGPPNAGKSSLMNALLKSNRAIVSDQPGTTRDTIEEWLDLDGWPIRLVDTAGLRTAEDVIESEGVSRAKAMIAQADIVIALGKMESSERVIAVHAKCDIDKGEGLNISSKTGEGLATLKREIVSRLAKLSMEAPTIQAEPIIAALSYMPKKFDDPVLMANAMRDVAMKLGELIGATYSEDLLDRLFSRFCVGK